LIVEKDKGVPEKKNRPTNAFERLCSLSTHKEATSKHHIIQKPIKIRKL